MTIDLNKARKEAGLNARYEGHPAKLLPLNEKVLAAFASDKDANIGVDIKAGDMIVTWRNENGKAKGEVLDPMAANELEIMIRKSDGEDFAVEASDLTSAIVQLAGLIKQDKQDRADVKEANDKGLKEHQAKIARGEIGEDEKFDPAKPRFADDAFANMQGLVDCVKSRLGAEYSNAFTGLAGKSAAALSEFKVGKATAHTLTDGELAKAQEARALRAQIAKLTENAETAAAAEREHGDERVEAALEDLRYSGEGFSAAQMAALMPSAELVELAFKPLTTTPPREIQARRFSPADVNTILQDLRRHEETEWAPGAIAKTRELLKDRMPGYDFQAKLFSRGGADMMLVADHAGAVLYAWDSETRVNGFDTSAELAKFTEDDVPTDAELDDLRSQLRDLQYNGAEDADFDFGDEEGEPEVLDA